MQLTTVRENLRQKFEAYKVFFKDLRVKKVFLDICITIVLSGKALISELSRFETTLNFKAKAKRFYRFFSRTDLPFEKIWKRFLTLESHKVHDDSMIIYDLSDISKNKKGKPDYNFKFEDICRVYDGSEKTTKDGYIVRCAGVYHYGQFSPLMFKISSFLEKDFTSENEWIMNDFDVLMKACDNRGTLVLDRGFDRGIIINHMLINNYKFILRLTEKRKYLWGEKNRFFYVEEIQRHIVPYYKNKPVPGIYHTVVFLNDSPDPLTLVIVVPRRKTKKTGLSKEPLYLLTTKMITSNSGGGRILKNYLRRWSIENYFQTIKSKFDIENIRIRKIKAIEMFMTIIMLSTSLTHDIFLKIKRVNKEKIKEITQSFNLKNKSYIVINLFRFIYKILDAEIKKELLLKKKFKTLFDTMFELDTYG